MCYNINMTVEELNLTIGKLTEAERLEVSRYIDEVIFARKNSKKPPVYTVEYLVDSANRSREELQAGKLLTHEQVMSGVRQRYGISA